MLLVKTPKDSLLSPLQAVTGIVQKNHTMPILANVLLEKAGTNLTFLATDNEIQIRTSVAEDSGEDQAITVGARKLQDILRALPEGVEVSLILEDKRMVVRAGKSRFTLQTLAADSYPRMSINDSDAVQFSISQKRLKRLLSQVQYAMAQQDIRYYLNGLLLVVAGSELRAVATDGHRLAYAADDLCSELPAVEVILPRKTVVELNRLLADSDEQVEITLAGNQARFHFGATELVSKLIDGKFPDYGRVIPKNHDKLLLLTRQTLFQALQRAAILTNDKFRGVRIVLTPGSLKIISSNAEQEEAQEELEVAYQGDALDIGFNVTYLLDVLSNQQVENIELRLADSNNSALITLPDQTGFKYVVMPMRI